MASSSNNVQQKTTLATAASSFFSALTGRSTQGGNDAFNELLNSVDAAPPQNPSSRPPSPDEDNEATVSSSSPDPIPNTTVSRSLPDTPNALASTHHASQHNGVKDNTTKQQTNTESATVEKPQAAASLDKSNRQEETTTDSETDDQASDTEPHTTAQEAAFAPPLPMDTASPAIVSSAAPQPNTVQADSLGTSEISSEEMATASSSTPPLQGNFFRTNQQDAAGASTETAPGPQGQGETDAASTQEKTDAATQKIIDQLSKTTASTESSALTKTQPSFFQTHSTSTSISGSAALPEDTKTTALPEEKTLSINSASAAEQTITSTTQRLISNNTETGTQPSIPPLSVVGISSGSLSLNMSMGNGDESSLSENKTGLMGGSSSTLSTTMVETTQASKSGSKLYTFAQQLANTRSSAATSTTDQVMLSISKGAKVGQSQMVVQVQPEELGRVNIQLNFAKDGSVTGTVTADNPATLETLVKDQRSLERALQDAGLKADQGCLSFNLGQSGKQSNGQSSEQNQARSLQDIENGTDLASQDTADLSGTDVYYVTNSRVNVRV